jgi:hypothetical protein
VVAGVKQRKGEIMKKQVVAIVLLVVGTLCPASIRSQQPQQPIKYFGYSGPGSTSDLPRVKSYCNFSYIGASSPSASVVSQVNALNSNGMKAIIDVSALFFCGQPSHICYPGYLDYWKQWVNLNSSVLNSASIIGFGLITAQSNPNVALSPNDIETAAQQVKSDFPGLITMTIDTSIFIYRDGHLMPPYDTTPYTVPLHVDWTGAFKYYTHPNTDTDFQHTVGIVQSAIAQNTAARANHGLPPQKMVYVLDGFWEQSLHGPVAPTPADMDVIAQEWYTVASDDPNSILLGTFNWDDVPDVGGTGSHGLPQNVLNEHAAIGAAILTGKFPTYGGYLDVVSCQTIAGWAWDSTQPNNPISVDIYDGPNKVAVVRANQFRQDLANAGIGNGYHAFWFTPPLSLLNGQNHSISVRASGTSTNVGASPRSLICSPSASIAWIEPSSVSWGPPNTMTVAGYAYNGNGGVQLFWRDVTANGSWNAVAYQAIPASDNTWSNTIPSSNTCHTYDAYVVYSGFTSNPPFEYVGANHYPSWCSEHATVTWIQPQARAGYGPPGSLIVAGSAKNAPAGTGVVMSYQDVTAGTGWITVAYAPPPDSKGIWLNSIPNVNYFHVYQVKATYDGVVSCTCTYQGNNDINWCNCP